MEQGRLIDCSLPLNQSGFALHLNLTISPHTALRAGAAVLGYRKETRPLPPRTQLLTSVGKLCSGRHHIKHTRDLAVKCDRAWGTIVSIHLQKEICKTEELDPNESCSLISFLCDSEVHYAHFRDSLCPPLFFTNADLKSRHDLKTLLGAYLLGQG